VNLFGLKERTVLVDDPQASIRIVADAEADEAALDLLSGLRFGSEGLEYRRLNLREQIVRLPSPAFLSLEYEGRLAGTYALATKRLASASGEVTGIYRGLLGIDPALRSSGLGRQLVATALDWIDATARELAEPVVSWGCIESANRPSLDLLASLGAKRIGRLESLTVFRQWPRRRIDVEHGAAALAGAVADALQNTYADCAIRPAPDNDGDYWAVTGDDGVVAGARATLTRVDMSRTGSFWDTAWQALLRFAPPARRRFDPRNFTYVRLSDVIVREGYERVWLDFLPTLLAAHDAYLAMFLLDPGSAAHARLDRARLFGRLTASTRQRVDVLAHTWSLDDALRNNLGVRPVAIGPLDL
jgi:GNAT superfamily N-acetyltransferase